ncbi:24815_t:CDS:2, partial [Gigaspora rosea]
EEERLGPSWPGPDHAPNVHIILEEERKKGQVSHPDNIRLFVTT